MVTYYLGGSKKFFFEIKKKGEIDTKKFYEALNPWFSGHGYSFGENKITSKDILPGQEMIFDLGGLKKTDNYFKLSIGVKIFVLKLTKGAPEITTSFKGTLETDYKKKFKGKFGNFLKNLYEEYLIKDKIDKMKAKLQSDVNALMDEYKRILNLITK